MTRSTDRFDWQTALEGLRLLELAHHRYDQAELGLVAARLDGEELYDALLWIYGLAVDTLTRARGLDDWCRGPDGGPKLPDYMDSLVVWDHDSTPGRPVATDQPSQSADLLAGARFVANKSIHVFATLARNTPVWIAPGGMDPTQFGLPVWLRADGLPPAAALGRRVDPEGRAAYVRSLAGNKIGWSLDALLGHFHWWLVEVPRSRP